MKEYEVIEDEKIRLVEGPYKGVTYQYGGVQFNPDYLADTLTLAFDLTIIEGEQPKDKKEFHIYVGDILMELIEESRKNKTTIYRSDPQEGEQQIASREEDPFDFDPLG